MSTNVFPLIPSWPLQQTLSTDTYVADFGDGFEQRVNFNFAYTRADGEGGVTSYKGRNEFVLKFNTRQFSSDANTLWHFFKQQVANLTAFYFYNVPDERSAIDLTGADTTGRYLVRFKDSMMTREKFTRQLENAGISLIEVRS